MLVHKIDPIELIHNLNDETYMDWADDFSFDMLFEKPDFDTEIDRAIYVKRYKPFNNAKKVLGDKLTNSIIYPPYGGMSWHTNGPNESKRMYASWSETGDSGMNWYDPEKDELIIDQDDQGWNIRVFTVPNWHCVWSKCYRLAIGYNIS